MVFQQRNGRIDRYGQKHQPHIVYLFTETVNDRIKGDWRILEILEKKDEQANFNLGDPSAFLNVYDPDKQGEKVSGFMADGLTPEQVETTLDQTAAKLEDNEGDLLMQLFGGGASEPSANQPAATDSSLKHIEAPASLFTSDFHYAKTALTQLNQGQTLCQWGTSDPEQIITITAPRDLQERLRQLPREVQAEYDDYSLCADPQRVAQAIEPPARPALKKIHGRDCTIFGHSTPSWKAAGLFNAQYMTRMLRIASMPPNAMRCRPSDTL